MEAIEAIMTRRSIRKYEAGPVPAGMVETLLRAGMAAPSARNEQPWHFIVVSDRAMLSRVPEMNPHALMAKDAALAIVVCADPGAQKAANDYTIQDCCLAGQNILLAAHSLGLGAVWTAIYPNEERVQKARQLFGIPPGIVPLCLIPLGWPAEKKPAESRHIPERIHREKW